jgi:hypothetical protein
LSNQPEEDERKVRKGFALAHSIHCDLVELFTSPAPFTQAQAHRASHRSSIRSVHRSWEKSDNGNETPLSASTPPENPRCKMQIAPKRQHIADHRSVENP